MKEIITAPRNCWRRVKAERAAFLVDGEAYFRALHDSFRRGRRSIFIVGWDLHSDLLLVRDGEGRTRPQRLGAVLDRLAALWRWSPASDWIDVASVLAAGEWLR